MKLSLVVATIFIILLVLFTGDQSTAQIGGNVDTDTTLTVPSNLVNGDSVTVNSMTSFGGGPVFNGHTTFYHLNDIRIKGDTDFGTSLSVTDPTFEFSVGSPMTLRAVRIPINSISTDAVIKWNISESVGPVLAEGEININEQLNMQQQGSLMIVIGSLQSDNLNNDNKYASGISLNTGNYKITISQSLVLDFESKASTSYQGVYAYENEVLQNVYPQLYLMGGSHRERVATVNGAASSTFTVSTGTSYVLAYYGDGELSFSPSHDLKLINVATNSPLTVSMIDYQSSPGSSITINANVMDGVTVVLGATVDFSILLNDILTPIGSATTNSAGDAQIFYLVDLEPGNYSIFAEATYNSQYGLINSELSLSQPNALWSNVQSDAEFGSEGLGITSVTISGTIKTQGGNPIVDTPVQIRENGSILATTNSDVNGDFSHTYLVNFVVGNYVDYYAINITDGFWDATPVYSDLIISKGQLFVNTDDVSLEFIDQPAHITGNVTNTPQEYVISTINLDQETSPGVWLTLDTIYSDSFDFTLQTQSAGSYNYRIRVDETAQWASVLQQVSVNIGPSNAAVSRGAWPTTFDIKYHQNYDLSAYVLKDDLSVIENADVKITVWDPVLEANVVIAAGLTDNNGLVTLSWIPSDSYLSLPGLSVPMTYSATHNDFVITDLQVFFTIVSSDLSLSLVENTWVYDTSNTIVFDTLDEFGLVVNEGTQFDIVIEGTTYTMTIDAVGQGSVTHVFGNVGVASISITTTLIDPYPYNNYSDILLYTIAKGDYIITGSSETVPRGINHPFTATITDHNGITLSNPVTAELWLFDIIWIKLGETTTASDFEVSADIILVEGTYTIEWRVVGNTLYNGASESYLFIVDKAATEILFNQVPTSYNFNDIDINREVTLLIQIPILNEPVSNQFVSIDFISPEDSYSWFLQTDINGLISFTLPQQPITGNYVLNINYLGNTDFVSSSSSTDIEVIGIDTILSWKITPTDGYYAEDQLFSLHAEDTLGNDLAGFTVDLTIGTDTFSVLTNSTGDATFNINMIYEGTVYLNMVLQAKDGWNSQIIDISIQIEKKQLTVTSEINSIMYSPTNNDQFIDFAIFVNSNNDPLLSNIKLELYWLNPNSGQFEFIDIYYTDINGYLYSTLSFPTINAAQSYVFNWLASDTDFLSYQFDQFYAVTPMSLDVTISHGSGNYMESTPIDFTVRDSNGLLISNLNIYASYTETIILWSESDTTSFGTSTINFYAPSVGELSVYYIISDIDGNYVVVEGDLIITIMPTDVLLNYSLDDDQGIVTLLLDVRNPANNVISEGTVVLESWQGTWVTEKTISLGQTNSMILNLYSDSMQFRLSYIANSHYSNSELIFNLYRQNLSVLNNPFEMEVSNGLPIYMELQGNSSLNGYLVEIHIYDEATGQWTNYGNMYTLDGIVNESIPVNLDIGNYQIRIVIPEQGWYRNFDQIYTLKINFNHFSFEIENDQFIGGVDNTLEIRINTSASDAVTNVQLDLYIIVNSNNIFLGSAYTNGSGNAIINFIPTQEYGYYTFAIVSTQTQLIESSSLDFQGTIGYTVSSDFIVTDTIDFDEGGILVVKLVDHNDQELSNIQVDVLFSIFDSVTLSFTESSYLNTLVSNSTGHIIIIIPPSILQSDILRVSISLSDPLITGNNLFDFDIQVTKIVPIISYQIDDKGVSQYATITMIVYNSVNESIAGNLSWKLKSGTQIIILEGAGELVWVDDHYQYSFDIEAIYIGEYQIIVDYYDNNILQKYLDNSIIFDLGWSKADAKVDNLTPIIVYESMYNISIIVSDYNNLHYLSGISVYITIDGTTYSGTTDISGLVMFELNNFPGTYSIEIEFLSLLLVNDKKFSFEIEILKGDNPVILGNPGNYSAIPASVDMEIVDTVNYDTFDEHYNVSIYRDGNLVNDTEWKYNHGLIIIYPVNSDNIDHLYPGSYRVELSRYHPYYTNSTAIREFIISPLYIDFEYRIETIDGIEYIIVSYDNDTEVDVEFTTKLLNADLSDEVNFINTNQIPIPWDRGAITIIIKGTGYVSGDATGYHDIPFPDVTNSISSTSNTTRSENNSGLESDITVNSIQAVGGLVIVATAIFAPAQKYIRRRK